MVQPIQYQIPGALNPFENLVSGLKLGTTMADMDAAIAQKQAATQLTQQKVLEQKAEMERQQKYQSGLNAFFAKPPAERSIEELQPLLAVGNKEQFDALKSIGDRMSADQLASSKKFTGQVLVALESNPESAKQILRQRADAEKDPMQKKAWEDTLKLAETSPEQAAKSVELLGAGVFGKDWYDNISNVRKERREASKAPFELRTAEAGAKKAEAEAGVAQGTTQAKIDEAKSAAKKAQIELETLPQIKAAEMRKAQSDADKAAVEAKFAEKIANADLKLKEAQRIASGAAAQSSLATAKKSEFEMKQGPSPLIATIQDPKNPTETITIDVRRYTPGTSIGSAGVIGSSGKSAVYAQKEAKAEEGKTLVADIIDSLKANYQTLNTARAIPSSQRGVLSNLLTAVEVSGPGQFASRITGSDVQPIRDVIQSSRLQLLNAIKQATGLSSQQLNSNVELQTWLKSVSDPTQQIEAVIPILENIEKFAGGGGKKIDSSKVNAEGGVDMNNPLLKK